MSEDRTLHGSPYVEQIEKYAHSLKQLSSTFLGLEEKKKAAFSFVLEISSESGPNWASNLGSALGLASSPKGAHRAFWGLSRANSARRSAAF